MAQPVAFLNIVQLHERSWGQEMYKGRPTLADLVKGPIVALWCDVGMRKAPDFRADRLVSRERFTMSAHATAESLNEMLAGLVFMGKVSDVSNRRLMAVYVNQERVEITGVRLTTKKVE